jgi:hypothetical protein
MLHALGEAGKRKVVFASIKISETSRAKSVRAKIPIFVFRIQNTDSQSKGSNIRLLTI